MSQLGLGVMIQMLGGNADTVAALKESIGQKIESVSLEDNQLQIKLKTGKTLTIFDDGQSCCEHRYMVTDDDLSEFTNTIFKNIEIKDTQNKDGEYGEVHEIQFLEITTGKGSFVLSNHNEHNGYYGGFWIVARLS